jgi:hypothetical protein
LWQAVIKTLKPKNMDVYLRVFCALFLISIVISSLTFISTPIPLLSSNRLIFVLYLLADLPKTISTKQKQNGLKIRIAIATPRLIYNQTRYLQILKIIYE